MNESCWKGYKQIGMKKKSGRTVPNCVKKNKFSFAEWLNENNEQYQGDSNPMDNSWVDTWHEAQKHAFSGNIQLAVSMMEKAAQQAWQESPGEAKYYLGTAAWLSDDKAKCLAMTKDSDVIQTGNDKVLRRLLNSKTSNYQHAYSLNENKGKIYYHGSDKELPVGTVLTGRQDNYESNWGHQDWYIILEAHRPPHMLSHKESVFMCDNPDDIDAAGGGTEYMFELQPIDRVEKHDMNWTSEISMLLEDPVENEEKIIEAANNYWNGIPHVNESLWEYLTPSAKILKVEPY